MLGIARTMPSKDVCASVRHTPTAISIETTKHIIKLFSPSDSPTILVFHTKRYDTILTVTPS